MLTHSTLTLPQLHAAGRSLPRWQVGRAPALSRIAFLSYSFTNKVLKYISVSLLPTSIQSPYKRLTPLTRGHSSLEGDNESLILWHRIALYARQVFHPQSSEIESQPLTKAPNTESLN